MKSDKADNRPEKRSQSDKADYSFGARLVDSLAGRTMKWLSEQTGIRQQTLSDYKQGTVPASDKAAAIAEALGVNLRWLVTGKGDPRGAESHLGGEIGPVETEVRGAGAVGAGEVSYLFHGDRPLPRLPLYGSAIGGEFGDVREHIELTELDLSDVLDYLQRPATLASDRSAYALTIVGDSMAPRFRPGERVAVSPAASVSIGDDVIVQLRGEAGGDDRVRMVLVKELVRRTASHVELRQHNPPSTFRVESRKIVAMHKVAGHFL